MKQSSVKCLAHTNTHFGIRIGAFPAKTKWTHWFLRDSDEGAANVGLLSLSLWHPNTEHLPFNCLGAMISLYTPGKDSVAMLWSLAHCLIGGPTSLGGPGRVRGGAEIPHDVMSTDFQISALEPPFFQRRAEQLVLVLHQTQVLAIGGP